MSTEMIDTAWDILHCSKRMKCEGRVERGAGKNLLLFPSLGCKMAILGINAGEGDKGEKRAKSQDFKKTGNGGNL